MVGRFVFLASLLVSEWYEVSTDMLPGDCQTQLRATPVPATNPPAP
jgi:hypothetical protein